MTTKDEARRELARRELARRRQSAQKDPRDSFMGKVDAGVRGAADALTLGFSDEIAAGAGTGFGFLGDYDKELARQRGIDNSDSENRFGYRLAGQLGGGVAAGAGLAAGGMSMAANAARAGGGLGRVAMGSAADGAIMGAASGFGSGEGLGGRLQGAVTGGAAGVVMGGAAPYAVAGVQALASPFVRPLMARMRPETYANRAMNEGIRRAGTTPDEIGDRLARAHADGQDMFTVADAMGHSGQRMLSTVARNPNDMRQTLIDTLTGRQMGQGNRLSNALAEGFNAPDTAAQRVQSLTGDRARLANVNYANASQDASPVNLNGALETIDNLLGRDPIMGETALSMGPMGARLRAVRDQMQNGGEQLIDFDRVVNLKSDMFQQMKRNPDAASDLRPVYETLDRALESASPTYRGANDAYRAQSATIDAVDAGGHAASGRTRAADTIRTFQGMEPGEQNAFRAGYVDPYIAKVESSAMSPTTNKARPLISEKTDQEFPALAIPQRADRMGRRIAREQQMFETSNAAMGGSKTADNLADASEMSNVDPSIMANLWAGRPVKAALDMAGRLMKEAQGQPASVIAEIGRSLLTTNPQAARALLTGGARTAAQDDLRRAIASMVLGQGGGATGGRLGAGRQPLELTVTRPGNM